MLIVLMCSLLRVGVLVVVFKTEHSPEDPGPQKQMSTLLVERIRASATSLSAGLVATRLPAVSSISRQGSNGRCPYRRADWAEREQSRIRRNQVASDQLDNVAGDQLVDRHRETCAVAPYGCLNRHRPAQRLNRILGADLLNEIEVILIVTMVTTTTKLATSPVAADSPLATSRMMTRGCGSGPGIAAKAANA